MEKLKEAVKEELKKSKYYTDIHGSNIRIEPKPFSSLSGRQRRKARKEARLQAK